MSRIEPSSNRSLGKWLDLKWPRCTTIVAVRILLVRTLLIRTKVYLVIYLTECELQSKEIVPSRIALGISWNGISFSARITPIEKSYGRYTSIRIPLVKTKRISTDSILLFRTRNFFKRNFVANRENRQTTIIQIVCRRFGRTEEFHNIWVGSEDVGKIVLASQTTGIVRRTCLVDGVFVILRQCL